MNRPSPDDMKAMWVMEYVQELEEENRNLKEKIKLLDNENMWLNTEIKDREEENKKLKEENEKLRIDREFEKWNTIFGM